jgi:serpin B
MNLLRKTSSPQANSTAAKPTSPQAGKVDLHSKRLMQGNTTFALDLYQKLQQAEGNLLFSPYSISAALGMTYAGARGDSEKQMAQVLHFALNQEQLHPAFASVEATLNAYQSKSGIQLHVANSLWPQISYPFLETFLALIKKNYGASIRAVDYADNEITRQRINAWIEEKTSEKIKDLIKPGLPIRLTRLVLANAIYFKGDWVTKFDPRQTENAPFWLSAGKSIAVPQMSQQGKFGYGENDSLQILELPYSEQAVSMIAVLPREIDGLAQLEGALTPANLQQWTELLRKREVRVVLPRFKTGSEFDLADALKSMGMIDAFDKDKANFSGMDGREKWLYIGAVLHQALIEVNEEGSEAAAATVVIMVECGFPEPLPTFRADHPFLFLIRENRTGSILFIGRVVNPNK